MTENEKKEIDKISGVETTGHEWDGLKELNNPLPRWWLIVFILCIVWSVGYWVIYPAWPTLSGNTKGTSGWTSHKRLKASQDEITLRQAKYLERFSNASLEEINNDPFLREFAIVGGAAAFKENCAACHGTGAAGRTGYPNLNDDDWLWGGKLADIYKTIEVGARSSHPDTRNTEMPAFGSGGILNPKQINSAADYVLSLSDPNQAFTEEGKKIFADNCVSCHGVGGIGNRELGAPSLNDAIWLYGKSRSAIYATISAAHKGVMPTWQGRLDENTIKELTIYIHSLGGGE